MKPNNYLMRKNLIFGFLILSLLLVSLVTKAAEPLSTPVELSVSPITDPILHPGQHRMPPYVPTVTLQEYTLTFSCAYVDWELQLWQDGVEVYSETLSSSPQVVLPSCLTGDYELRIVGSSYYYHGYISLGNG